jgi:hypothetical protein
MSRQQTTSNKRLTQHRAPFEHMFGASDGIPVTESALLIVPASNASAAVQTWTNCAVRSQSVPERLRIEIRSETQRRPEVLERKHRSVMDMLMRHRPIRCHSRVK